MMNFNDPTNIGTPNSASLAGIGLTSRYFMNESEFERRLEGLDDETRKEVRKHFGEFHTIEEMEMFIQQKTRGRDKKESFT